MVLDGDGPRHFLFTDVQRSLLAASREPQRSMTSRGYDPRQSPGLGYKRVVSCKDSSHGTDVLAGSEHGAPGRRPNIHADLADPIVVRGSERATVGLS